MIDFEAYSVDFDWEFVELEIIQHVGMVLSLHTSEISGSHCLLASDSKCVCDSRHVDRAILQGFDCGRAPLLPAGLQVLALPDSTICERLRKEIDTLVQLTSLECGRSGDFWPSMSLIDLKVGALAGNISMIYKLSTPSDTCQR